MWSMFFFFVLLFLFLFLFIFCAFAVPFVQFVSFRFVVPLAFEIAMIFTKPFFFSPFLPRIIKRRRKKLRREAKEKALTEEISIRIGLDWFRKKLCWHGFKQRLYRTSYTFDDYGLLCHATRMQCKRLNQDVWATINQFKMRICVTRRKEWMGSI